MSDAFLDPELPAELCAWYREVRRTLPWRRDVDPYRVWVSEVMLQQTRVEAVVDAYARFLERFEDVAALAAAPEEDVLAAWSGLGYYRRARGLHAAAREVVERHGGRFPDDAAEALALTGVGRYTAGAVRSIAYGRSAPVVDGNVARVFARWFLLEDAVGTGALDRRLWELAERLVPADGPRGAGANPGDWNQALMELGATVCTPKSPACERCPVADRCGARAAGRVAELPRRRPEPERVLVSLEALAVERDGAWLLVRRPAAGRMAGLWEPPLRELGSAHLWAETFPAIDLAAGLDLEPDVVGRFKHSITRHAIEVVVRRGVLVGEGDGPSDGAPARFVTPDELADLGTSGLARKVLRAAGR